METLPIDLKKLGDAMSRKALKNIKLNKLNTKLDNFFRVNLIHKNQCNTDKQSLDKNIEDFDKKIPDVSNLLTNTALNTKIGKVETKLPDVSYLATKTPFKTKTDKD